MTAGTCKVCGETSVHRSHREHWQRALAWVVPVRPQQCMECGHRSWGVLRGGESGARWLSSAVIWGVSSALVWGVVGGSDEPLVQPQPAAAPASSQASLQEMEASTAPESVEPTPDTTPGPDVSVQPPEVDPSRRKVALQQVDVRWTGTAMEVVLRAEEGPLPFDLSLNDMVRGYVLDLPGTWTLPATLRTTRSFERSNLQRMRIGRHPGFLRIVFSLRQPDAPAPVVEDEGATLRILVR